MKTICNLLSNLLLYMLSSGKNPQTLSIVLLVESLDYIPITLQHIELQYYITQQYSCSKCGKSRSFFNGIDVNLKHLF